MALNRGALWLEQAAMSPPVPGRRAGIGRHHGGTERAGHLGELPELSTAGGCRLVERPAHRIRLPGRLSSDRGARSGLRRQTRETTGRLVDASVAPALARSRSRAGDLSAQREASVV